MNSLLLWFLLLSAFYLMYALGAQAGARRTAAPPPPEIPPEKLAACSEKLAPLMAITGHRVVGEFVQFEGSLRGAADEIFPKIRDAFAGESVSPMLLEGEGHHTRVMLFPGAEAKSKAPDRPNWPLHWLLFFATVATTTWAGALTAGVNIAIAAHYAE